MSEAVVALLSGGIGAAATAGIMSIIIYKIQRADAISDEKRQISAAHTTALRYMMLFMIRWQGTELIQSGSITWEDRKMMHKWHELYHNELGGNGDADLLMAAIDNLPLEMEGV